MNIDGKRTLITGGSSGIGLATARALGARGARLVITGRDATRGKGAVETLRGEGLQVAFLSADVATEAGRESTLGGALALHGGLDILINNAGGVRAGTLEAMSEAEIRAMIEVDLVAPILLARAALPHLRAGGEGLVVNVTSAIALVGLPFYAAYAAAKAGLARFGESLRREQDGEGVRVLTVYPGGTDTPMMASSRAGPELGFSRESADAVGEAIAAGIEGDALDVVRGGEARAQMIALNAADPLAVDRMFAPMKAALADAVRDHSAL
jgi:NAD(P)-dependent dehydrogenase (short-subunit alcohol dehydrogenase family)